MAFTYLITSEELEWVDQYDNDKLNYIIKDVQLSFIKPIFPNYYNALVSEIENNSLSKNDEKILNDYIKMMMNLLCENELVRKGSLKITNTGANIETGEEFERQTSSQRQAIITNNEQKIQTYKIEMLEYMKTNINIFPNFTTDYKCKYMDYEETFNMSTVKGVYNNSGIYGRDNYYYDGNTDRS